MTFLYPTLTLASQLMKYIAQILLELSIQHLATILWNPNNVILALPYRVT